MYVHHAIIEVSQLISESKDEYTFFINNPFFTLVPKIVYQMFSRWSINFYYLNIQTF